jgi:hypothetical protein
MKTRAAWLNRSFAFIALLAAVTLAGCGGTGGGNPGEPVARVILEVGPSESTAVTHLSICPTQVRLVDENGGSETISLPLSETELQSSAVISSIDIPRRTYTSIELELAPACDFRSLQVTNANGTFQAIEPTTLKFAGSYAPSGMDGEKLRLIITPIESKLLLVASDQALKAAAEGASGTLSLSICPDGFVPVPALSGYATSPFCVMKYEAKQVGGAAVSQAAGLPWTGLSQVAARVACTSLGRRYDVPGSDYWQSIARNIESVASNWAGGTVGNASGINLGHYDGTPSAALAASSDGDPCYGTGASCTSELWNIQRRTHTLSNGSVIWDLSGNVWEFQFDTPAASTPFDAPVIGLTGGWKAVFGPAGDWSALSSFPYAGMGYAHLSVDNGVVVRGGSWSGGDAGIFATSLDRTSSSTSATDGFRCVYVP